MNAFISRSVAVCTAGVLLMLLAAGCGGGDSATKTRTTTTTTRSSAGGLPIGVVGGLPLHVPGAAIEHGRLEQVADAALVIVPAGTRAAERLPAVATAHPTTHFALLGGSARNLRLANVVGVVIRNDQAALLTGVVAGLAARDAGAAEARVAWVGPQTPGLVASFTHGLHNVLPEAIVLRGDAPNERTRCKEAALREIDRGAVAVASAAEPCGAAAADGAHERNVVAARMSQFELPLVPAAAIAQDAVDGLYHGREDLVFGANVGAVAVGRLDPRLSSRAAVAAHVAAQQLASGRPATG